MNERCGGMGGHSRVTRWLLNLERLNSRVAQQNNDFKSRQGGILTSSSDWELIIISSYLDLDCVLHRDIIVHWIFQSKHRLQATYLSKYS